MRIRLHGRKQRSAELNVSGVSVKKCTTERTWQLGERGVSERVLRCLCVTNTKTSQDHLSVSVPLDRGTPSVNGGLNQGQLISGSPASNPACLLRLTDCSGNRRIEVLKRQG